MLTPALASLLDSLNKISGESLTDTQRAIRHELELLDRHRSVEAMGRALDRSLDSDFRPIIIAGITYGPKGSDPCQFCNSRCP